MKLDSNDGILEEVDHILGDADARERNLTHILYKEILLNALKTKRDQLDRLDLKVLSRAMAEFRYAARVFKPYRHIRKVSIFGSARTPENDPVYQMAVDFSRMLAEDEYMVITGAAEGIMKAGNVGAGRDKSFGVNILLPFEQSANVVIDDDPKLITFKYFFTRKLFFLMEAHAVALFPGGFGTQDEGFETLTLVQTGKAPVMPLMLLEPEGHGYWEAWHYMVTSQLLAKGLISPEDLTLYKIFHKAEDALSWLKFYYSTYHSSRLVRGRLVVRMERDLRDANLEELNDTFSDLMTKGKIERTERLKEEMNEPELTHKPRIVFNYNQLNAARLNEMVIRINEMGQQIAHDEASSSD